MHYNISLEKVAEKSIFIIYDYLMTRYVHPKFINIHQITLGFFFK